MDTIFDLVPRTWVWSLKTIARFIKVKYWKWSWWHTDIDVIKDDISNRKLFSVHIRNPLLALYFSGYQKRPGLLPPSDRDPKTSGSGSGFIRSRGSLNRDNVTTVLGVGPVEKETEEEEKEEEEATAPKIFSRRADVTDGAGSADADATDGDGPCNDRDTLDNDSVGHEEQAAIGGREAVWESLVW